MATWEDGPEYAPVDWPTGFVAPAIGPLSQADPVSDPSAGAPIQPPTRFDPPQDHVPALASLVPDLGPSRNPIEPFQVASAIVTDGSAWGSVHSVQAIAAPAPTWTPDQAVASGYAPPPQVQGFPAPGTPEWFRPPGEYAANQLEIPLTFGNVTEGLGWGLIITLVLGGVISFLSPVLLAVGFFLVASTRFRRKVVKLGFVLALVIVGLAGIGGIVGDQDAWTPMAVTGQIACWLVLAYGIVVQIVAIRGGDRPEH